MAAFFGPLEDLIREYDRAESLCGVLASHARPFDRSALANEIRGAMQAGTDGWAGKYFARPVAAPDDLERLHVDVLDTLANLDEQIHEIEDSLARLSERWDIAPLHQRIRPRVTIDAKLGVTLPGETDLERQARELTDRLRRLREQRDTLALRRRDDDDHKERVETARAGLANYLGVFLDAYAEAQLPKFKAVAEQARNAAMAVGNTIRVYEDTIARAERAAGRPIMCHRLRYSEPTALSSVVSGAVLVDEPALAEAAR